MSLGPMTADEPAMKFEPVIVICTSIEDRGSAFGVAEAIDGTGLTTAGVTVNVTFALVPPPGDGFETETWGEPGFTRSPEGIEAATCVDPMKVVGSCAPSQST